MKIAAGAIVLLVALTGCAPGDTVDGCAKRLKTEWALNMADENRKVVDDLTVFKECDGLTADEQHEASDQVATDVVGKMFEDPA